MSKYIDHAWYAVFDGTSYYALLGMDIEDAQKEDSDIEVISGPHSSKQVDQVVDKLNYEAYAN